MLRGQETNNVQIYVISCVGETNGKMQNSSGFSAIIL